ncbi:MAG: LytTR family DNA-binding domain-containing protein [Bacteroidota bacterium]
MITVVLIDDESLALDTLVWQLEQLPHPIQITGRFTNPISAVEALKTTEIDLCFLDIDMPEMTGFEFLEQWETPPFDVIFTTAYDQYAIRAFQVSACDYLLKPIDDEDLEAALDRYQNRQSNLKKEQIGLLTAQFKEQKAFPDRVALPTSEGVHIVETAHIIRLEADKNYTQIFQNEGSSIIVSKTIKEVEQLFDPAEFCRVHQSHLVNLSKVALYRKGKNGGLLTLKDNTQIPVAKAKKKLLMERLGIT